MSTVENIGRSTLRGKLKQQLCCLSFPRVVLTGKYAVVLSGQPRVPPGFEHHPCGRQRSNTGPFAENKALYSPIYGFSSSHVWMLRVGL